MSTISRREYIKKVSALAVLPLIPNSIMNSDTILTRPIPSTNDQLPVIGLGTWQTFDVGEKATEIPLLKEVLKALHEKGGRVIDSSPMYGRSEKVVGNLSTQLNLNSQFFMATKVWTSGRENGIHQMNDSFSLLKRRTLDLMQIHNLVDWQTHFKTLQGWKEEGRIKYIGITHYTESAFPAIEKILHDHPVDFIQINYSILSRKAEERLLPLAQEKKVAVLINQPFEEGALFQKVKGREIPVWSKEFGCGSWAQFFLKFILSHPAVTCVIPGTSKPKHMLDNLCAGFGELPNEELQKKMIGLMES